MALIQFLALATIAAISSTAHGNNECFQCGYQQEIVDGVEGPPIALPDMPECKDHASQMDNKVVCEGEDDCCGSIREWIEIVDNETGETKSLLMGRHDCETALKAYSNYDVLCSDHTDSCEDIAEDQLPQGHNDTIKRAKICFCSGSLCNWHVPGLDTPAPEDTTKKGKQCYNCGHRKLPNGDEEELPDLPMCGDFATPEDITTNCENGDDCCATLKEYFTTIDEDTGENSTVIIGRHGCESDLNHIGEQTVLCSDHTDACLNIDRSSLPDHQDHNVTVTDIEICFCSGDRCNEEDPLPPIPTTASPGGGSSSIVASIVVLLLALLC